MEYKNKQTMNFFKSVANWLFSEERKQIQEEISKINRNIYEIKINKTTLPTFSFKARLIGDTIVVIFGDGSILEKEGASVEDFIAVKKATTIDELAKILSKTDEIKYQMDEEEKKVFAEAGILKNHKDFEIKNNKVYFKDIPISIPEVIIATFIEIVEKLAVANKTEAVELNKSYEALVMFWLKLAMNPLEQSREDILLFIKKNDIHITKYGNMVLYRRIVSKSKSKDTKDVMTISTWYANVKKNKKSPKKYLVYKDKNDKLSICKESASNKYDNILGSLEELYVKNKESKDNKFTASHDRSVNIVIGDIYSIPDNKINLNNGLCAAGGLHAASVNYDYSSFGDVPVVVLVSPSKAITVPTNDFGKLRTTEMFVVCVNNKPHGVHFDNNGVIELDENYHQYTINQLTEAIKDKSLKTVSVEDNIADLTINNLIEIKKQLNSRIVKI